VDKTVTNHSNAQNPRKPAVVAVLEAVASTAAKTVTNHSNVQNRKKADHQLVVVPEVVVVEHVAEVPNVVSVAVSAVASRTETVLAKLLIRK